MGTRTPGCDPWTCTFREFGRGFTAASSTWAVAAMNLGLAFMALLSCLPRERRELAFNASLRRHYPHQVRRVCSHPTGSRPARTPTLLERTYSKPYALASASVRADIEGHTDA